MRVWARLLVGALLVACEGGGVTHEPCDDDGDCPTGRFCRAGVGCDFDCRADIDCVPLGGGTCDPARGRCEQTSRMDGGTPDGSIPCASDSQCDDGVFCNGAETCVGGTCGAGEPPCSAADCDEAADSCDRCLDPDRDDDGYDSVECGGRDCNDDDPRIPRAEVCDDDHVDEDCNPATVGSVAVGDDADGDGFLPTTCCNRAGDELRCGNDCDDTRPNVNPSALEVCDGIDNNCDGVIDPGCECTPGVDPPRVCGTSNVGECQLGTQSCIGGSWETSCAGAVEPTAEVRCNGRDEDCDGIVDEGVPATGTACYEGYPVETAGVGACRYGSWMCGSTGLTCVGAIGPAGTDPCDGVDNNCNGTVDDGSECVLHSTRNTNDECGVPVTDTCIASSTTCNWGNRTWRTSLGFSGGFSVYDAGSSFAACPNTYLWPASGSVYSGYEIRNQPQAAGGPPVCEGLYASPLESRFRPGVPMVASVFVANAGCVRFKVRVVSEFALLAQTADIVFCEGGYTSHVVQVAFTTPSRTSIRPCPWIRVIVDAIDIPSSQFFVSGGLYSPG